MQIFLTFELAHSQVRKNQGNRFIPSYQKKLSNDFATKELDRVRNLINNGQYGSAASHLFQIKNRRPENLPQVIYLLGLSLKEAGYYQLAGLTFVELLRSDSKSYAKQAVDQLIEIADFLNDSSLVKYVVSKAKDWDRSARIQSLLEFLKAEVAMNEKDYENAINYLRKIDVNSPFYQKAQYRLFLAYLSGRNPDQAIVILRNLLDFASNRSDREILIMNMARAFYQKKDFERAIKLYENIPRYSKHWPQSLFELSWAQLRAARFRSVIGTLQTLHSPFLKDEYYPETYIVRSIVYLYICRFEEAEITLKLFQKSQGALARRMINYYFANKDNSNLLIRDFYQFWKNKGVTSIDHKNDAYFPQVIADTIVNNWELESLFRLHEYLLLELESLKSDRSLSDELKAYGRRAITKRRQNIENRLVTVIRSLIEDKIKQWRELEEQAQFINLEIISGKKEMIKSSISGKSQNLEIDQNIDRDFYVASGYEYWPVGGEIWLDELGNFYFLGVNRCH